MKNLLLKGVMTSLTNMSPMQILVPELGMTSVPMTCCANFGLYSVRYDMSIPSSIGQDYQLRLRDTITRVINDGRKKALQIPKHD